MEAFDLPWASEGCPEKEDQRALMKQGVMGKAAVAAQGWKGKRRK